MRTIFKRFEVFALVSLFLIETMPAMGRPPMMRMGMGNPGLMPVVPRTTMMAPMRVPPMATGISAPTTGGLGGKIMGPLDLMKQSFAEPNPILPPGTVRMQTSGSNFTVLTGTTPFTTNTTLSPTMQFMALEQAALNFSMNPGSSVVPTGMMTSLFPPGLNTVLPPGFNVTFPTTPIVNPLLAAELNGLTLGNPLLTTGLGMNPLLLSSISPVSGMLNGTVRLSPTTSLMLSLSPNFLLLNGSGFNSASLLGLASLSTGGMTTPMTLPFVLALNSDVDLTPQQERELLRKLTLVKSQTGASSTTVLAALDLNTLLDDLRAHPDRAGRDLPLSEAVMQHVNIVPAKSYANAGLLKNDRRWPELLKRDEFQTERDQIEALIPKLVSQAKEGAVKTEDLQTLDQTVKAMREKLASLIQETPDPVYIRAKRFVTDLQSGVKVLRQPDAAGYFSPVYSPKAKTVQELVRYMTKNDLRFAPATTGGEAAYLVFYRALATYDHFTGPSERFASNSLKSGSQG